MALPYLLLIEALLMAIALPALSVRPARGLWSMLLLGGIPFAAFAVYVRWAGDNGVPLLAGLSQFGGPFLLYTWIRNAGGYRHRRVGGGPDRRYRDNPWVPAFSEHGRMVAGFGHLGNLLGGAAAAATVFLSPPIQARPGAVEFPVTVTATTAENAIVRDTCYLRARPRQDGEVVDTLATGTTLVVAEKLGLWWQVAGPKSRGFIHRSCVKPGSRQ
jgi:hypothetical protein